MLLRYLPVISLLRGSLAAEDWEEQCLQHASQPICQDPASLPLFWASEAPLLRCSLPLQGVWVRTRGGSQVLPLRLPV